MLKQYFGINTAIGIQLNILGDGAVSVSACQIAKQHQQLDFEHKITGLNSLKEISKTLSIKIPVALNIFGKGVLIKQTEKLNELTPLNFGPVLPNANFDDFYIQNFISGERSYIAVIRKSEADKWIAQVEELGYRIVMLSLGPFTVHHILPQLNFYDSEIVFDGHVIQSDEQKHWKSYRYEETTVAPFPLKVESEKIDEKLILAYASAFQLIMADQLEPIQTDHSIVEQNYKDALTTKWIKAFGSIVIVTVFLLLLINFVIFSWLGNENTKLAYQVSRSAQSTSDMKGIEEQVKFKEHKLKMLGWYGGINKAHLMDDLASILPSEITWKNIEINPMDAQGSRDQKTLVFKDQKIRVTGLSQQVIPVNEWMARIKTKTWVKTVELESYIPNQELNTGEFTIIITY